MALHFGGHSFIGIFNIGGGIRTRDLRVMRRLPVYLWCVLSVSRIYEITSDPVGFAHFGTHAVPPR